MTLKSLAAGVAAVAATGAVAAGMTAGVIFTASVTSAAPNSQQAVFGVPYSASGFSSRPLAPSTDVPTPDQLITVLNGLQNPNVPFASKSYLVEGGIGGVEGHIADRKLQKAAANGSLPLSFNIANITPAGPGTASADVTATGPHLAPTTQNITFVNEGGWKLSRGSALTLLQAVQAASG